MEVSNTTQNLKTTTEIKPETGKVPVDFPDQINS